MNLFSDDLRRNPYPLYEQLRGASPVLEEPRSGLWMIFDYEGVKRALNDYAVFSSCASTVANHSTPQWLLFFDPPYHTKLRGIISKTFTPKAIANLESRIRELSRELLDKTVERGQMDLAQEYSVPLPMMVIAGMIGIPIEDWARFKRWSDGILKLSYAVRGISPAEQAMAASNEFTAVHEEMKAYMPELIEQRRSAPKDDLLSRLVAAEVDGEGLSEKEMLGFLQLLIVGGQETTTNLINNAILCFVENPDQLGRLRKAPEFLPIAIEEVLRYRSPIQFVFRATKQEVEMHGQVIPSGKLVLIMLGSANRDPRQFRDPNQFDISRDPNPHLAFGHGIHFCLGAVLSRLEARIALSDILQRVRGIELASNQPWEPRKALHVHGPTRLPIRFEVGSRVGAAI